MLKDFLICRMASAGFSLIEVLVSLLLLACIVLSFDAMEMDALHLLRSSYDLNIAIDQLDNMSERLHVLGQYPGIESQVAIWNRQNQKILPKSRGTVSGHYPFFTITLYWGDACWARENVKLI